MVRGVSEKNFGIEFMYWCEVEEENSEHFNGIKKYRQELIDKYGKSEEGKYGFYAWDYESGIYSSDSENPIPEAIVVYKPFK